MANDQNLIPNSERTPNELREQTSKAGKASGEARRAKRDIRRALEALLEKDYEDKSGNVMSGTETIALKQMEKAMKGDTRAFEIIRDTVGQKPIEKVEQVNIDMEYQQSVEYIRKLMGDE